MTAVSLEQAEMVLAAVRKQWMGLVRLGLKPQLIMDWDWFGSGPVPSIVWEEGPFRWPYLFPHGGRNEFGTLTRNVSGDIPDGVFVEAATHFAVSIYPN